MEWNEVVCGFNTADETLNFGTRALAGDCNLFEACTLASISSAQKQNTSTLSILSCVRGNKLIYTINRTAGVFSDLNCSELSFNVNFEAMINTLCVTNDAKYAMVGLQDGTIHCIDLEEQSIIFEEKILGACKSRYIDSFIGSWSDGLITLIIITETGDVFRLRFNDTMELISNEVIEKFNCRIDTAQLNYPYLLIDGSKLCVYNLETSEEIEDYSGNIKKIVIYNDYMFLLLHKRGHLISICKKTLLQTNIQHSQSFKDIVFLRDQEDKCLLIAITNPDETGSSYVQSFISLTDFENPKFSLKCTDAILLIEPEYVYDDCIFISEIKKEGTTTEIRFQVLCETVPEQRLEKLFKRHKFDEAEKFATLFNIDQAEIVKGRAIAICTQIKCTSEDVERFLQLLDNIDDVAFKLQCCFDVFSCCNEVHDAKKVLQYACCKSVICSTDSVNELESKLAKNLFRLDTFTLLQRYDNHMNWHSFMQQDLVELFYNMLQKVHIEMAIIVYNRLDSQITIQQLEKALKIVNALPLKYHTPILHSLVPISLARLPGSISTFLLWLKEKVLSIEKNYYSEFPQNAIDFMNSVIKLLEFDNSGLFSGRTVTYSANRKSAEELTALMEALNRIKLLRDTYHIAIPLKECLKGSKAFIHLLLMAMKLSEDSFHKFYNDFLYDFMLTNYFQPDDILLEEIEDIVKYQDSCWFNIPQFLQHISSVDKKLKAIHIVATTADVPWSPLVRDIAASALVYDHPLVADIVKAIENEPSKVVLKKTPYGLHYAVDSDDWERWISRIIYCNLPTMVDDVFTLCNEPRKKQFAYLKLFHSFVKNRKFADAIEILKNIPSEEQTTFYERITLFCTVSKNVEMYSSVLNFVEQYWKNSGAKSCHDERLQQTFKSISSYFVIKGILSTISYKDFQHPSKRNDIYDNLLTKVVDDFKTNNDLMTLDNSLQQIAKGFDVPKEDVMVTFVRKCENFKAINYCAEHFYLYETNTKNLCDLALLIINNIPSSMVLTNLDLSSEELIIENMSSSTCTDNADAYLVGVNLALKLATKALLNSSQHDLDTTGNVYDMISHLFYFTSGTTNLQITLFPNAFSSKGITRSIHRFCAVKSIMDVYTSYKCIELEPITDVKSLSKSATSLTEPHLLKQISQMVCQLQCEGQLLVAYEALFYLLNRQYQTPNIDNRKKETLKVLLIQKCVAQLLQKVFAAKVVDKQLALRLLLSYDDDGGVQVQSVLKQYITLYRRNAPKLNIIVHLAIEMFNYHGVSVPESYINHVLLSKWWMKIDNCQIQIKTFYTASSTDLLELLILHKHVDLSNMNDYCYDFNINLQLAYNLYLKNLITNWKPEYKVVKSSKGKSELIMISTEHELYEECKKVFLLITSKECLQKYLEKIASMINFYHYEPFVCVFNLCKWLNKDTDITAKLQLLGFLQTYIRVKEPTEREVEEWYSLFPDSQRIDPLSQWRLPFTQTFFSHDIWTIIRPEMNLNTYRVWFNAVAFLPRLNKDDICSYVVKEVVSSNVLKKDINTNWVLHPVHEHLFEEVDHCIQNISNLELATSAMYHLMINVPEGADQVNAATLCLKYAVKYNKSSNSSDSELMSAFTKIEKKFLKYSVTHILKLCQLDIKQYSECLLQPDELIEALYADKWIIKRFDAVALNCPDINKAVEDIAILFDINIEEKRKVLLEEYLFNIPNNVDIIGLAFDDESCSANLKRAAYICQSGDLQYWQKFLLNKLEDSMHRPYYSANALKCLTLISEVESIEAMVDMPYNDVMNYIDKMYLLGDLELSGHSIPIEQLNKYNKIKFLQRLAVNIQNPDIAKIMGNLCIVYSIYDVTYWDMIVNASIKFNLYSNIKKYVQFWSGVDNCKYKKFYINAWQYLIDNALNVGSDSDEQDIFFQCIKNMQMIQTCPVLFSLKFENVFNTFCQFGKVELAAVIIQYMPYEDQDKYLSDILSISFNVPDFSPLLRYGILGIETVQQLFIRQTTL